MKHKHYDLIVWWASDPENNIVQYNDPDFGWRECTANRPGFFTCEEYRKKPNIVKRWKWVFAFMDEGHTYESISHKHYTEEEANTPTALGYGVIWKQKIEATEKEFTE